MAKVREILLKNDNNTFNDCFGHNLKCYRKRLKLNQEDLADKLGYSIDQVRNWEQGRNIPNIDVLDNICKYLDCDIDHLFGRLPEKTHDNHFICEATGLTEAAVDTLCNMKKYCDLINAKSIDPVNHSFRKYLNTISMLVNWHKILETISEYLAVDKKKNYIDPAYEDIYDIPPEEIEQFDKRFVSTREREGTFTNEVYYIDVDGVPITNEIIKQSCLTSLAKELDKDHDSKKDNRYVSFVLEQFNTGISFWEYSKKYKEIEATD